MGLIKALREEMPVIRQAPWAIGSSVLILTAAAAVVIYALFSADLSAKTSLINTLTGQVAALQREVETLKSGAKTDPRRMCKLVQSQPRDSPLRHQK